MFLRSGWSTVRSALLTKGCTLKKRPSLHLHGVPTWNNKVSPQTLQMALVYGKASYNSYTNIYHSNNKARDIAVL
jgi:hypothetical protein